LSEPLVLATCESRPELTSDDERLRAALERRGASVAALPWTQVPHASGLVCLRSTWDYHLRWPDFRRWVHAFARWPGTLWNPPETVLWNADKAYLEELAARGVRIPRTRWFETGVRPDCDALLQDWNAPIGVLKPRISATAYGTHRLEKGARLDDEAWRPLETHGCVFQAFVPEIETNGELSLISLEGTFSHAVRKRPARGDFRVQQELGGRWEIFLAPRRLREWGARVLSAVPLPWVYARVDLVVTDQGPVLMELELIEPQLFLTPSAAERLADALLAKRARPPGGVQRPRIASSRSFTAGHSRSRML
jgi:hypothetical protein